MMPITPRGTRIRPTVMPEGCVLIPLISPTGSGRRAIWANPCAMASIRARVNSSRSSSAPDNPVDRAALRSAALASPMRSRALRICWAIASNAAFFCPVLALATSRAAERAASPDSCIQSLISPDTMDILFILSMIYSVIRIKRIYTTKQQHDPLQFGPDTPRRLTLAFEYLIGNRQTMQHACPLGGVQSSQGS